MVAHQNEAWVTAVLKDEDVKKAIVLAASLRRALTTKKIVAIFSSCVSEDNRDLLRDKFDLAVLIDHYNSNGVHAEDIAKVFGFSLTLFSKCVYLANSTMVLQNCDLMFQNDKLFGACVNDEGQPDTSVFLFTPSFRQYKAMRKLVGNKQIWKNCADVDEGYFTNYFGKWLFNQKGSTCCLDKKYNQKLFLMTDMEVFDGLQSDLGIVDFVDVHPIEFANMHDSTSNLGITEMLVAERWLMIYREEMETRGISQTDECSLLENPIPSDSSSAEPIAVVGMSCRYPGANNNDEFWKLLIEGRHGIQRVPQHRWTRDTCLEQSPNRTIQAGFLDTPIDEFDAKFFEISPKDAVFLDPQQRLLHEVTWEAFEDAGIDPSSIRGTLTGIFVGSWLHDYKDMLVKMPDVDFYRVYSGTSIASGAARLAHFLGTNGPSIATESGCSSSIVAVDMACKSLRNRESHLAIACGVNVILHPFDQSMLSFVLAEDGRCKTFDAKADGFGRAEGCGILLLKRLSEAVNHGDKIWGLIRGSAVTQEGLSNSLGTPTVHCEALAMELALKDAGVEPKDVSFVETHGTGTSVGDPIEVAAVTKTYSKDRRNALVIGSVKTNVGHTESVSGITGIQKVLLSLTNEVIPRHLNFETLNPDINLDLIPATISLTETPWPRTKDKPRLAGVSSFGISGGDGHVIVEEAPSQQEYPPTRLTLNSCIRPLHIMKLSAKTPESLGDLLEKYKLLLDQNHTFDFADFAYTANIGRTTFNHRAIIIARDNEDASKIIQQNAFKRAEVQTGGGKLCFLFTGQGSQYPGMASALYNSSPVFKISFDKCNKILQSRYGICMKEILWNEATTKGDLSRTLYSQISIFCVEYALLKLWQSWGVKPDYVLGHSLGEFAAAVAIGALDLPSALHLVAERSRLIDALPQGKMIVVKADKNTVDKIICEFKALDSSAWLDYAALNSSDQTVLAGNAKVIAKFEEFCTGKNVKTVILAATHAFHSRHMDPMLEEYRKVASNLKRGDILSNCQYISGMDGGLLEVDNLRVADYWLRHAREKVSFIDACKTAKLNDCMYFLEIGPHPVLSALTMANIDGPGISCFPSLRRKMEDWETMFESLGKLFMSNWTGVVSWKGIDEYLPRRKIPLPLYPFSRKKVWVDVISNPTKIHPLVGAQLENASSITIFENSVTLKRLPYLQDHVIGNSVVFPGAGFLEMCLVAGYSHAQGLVNEFIMPRRPITLKEFKIEAPLGVDDTTRGTQIQVVVDIEDGGAEGSLIATGYKTKVSHWHRPEEGDGHWVSHASATFIPTATDDLILNSKQIDVRNIKVSWQESTASSDLYKNLPDVGLRFGPSFQSLGNAWTSGTGSESLDNILVAVKVPKEIENYIAHPILVDAMLQTAMLLGSKSRINKKLHVPVCIRHFTWFRQSDSAIRFVYAEKDAGSGTLRVSLVDGDGHHLMTMSGIDFVETTSSIVESTILQQSAQMPTLWDEFWRHKPTPRELEIVYGKLEESESSTDAVFREKSIFPEDILQKALELNNLCGEDKAVYLHLCHVTVLHFTNALLDLGWQPICGHRFTLDGLMSTLAIVPTMKNFTQFFIKCLTADGYFKLEPPGEYLIIKELPSKSDLLATLHNPNTQCYSSRVDYQTVYRIGEKLADIFLGKFPPLQILFPDDGSLDVADALYSLLNKIITRSSDLLTNHIIANSVASIAKVQNTQLSKMRILEVGAGTGLHTGLFLSAFEQYNLPYEYTYTDISAAFFSKAEKKFEKYRDNMIFRKFNIEEDPLQQGFIPDYYDVIISAEVLHVARNIREALANLRLLLRDGGSIQIIETTKQDRRLTFVFGLLDGYWRFEDHDLRPDHITLSADTWKMVLDTNGFEQTTAIPCYASVHSIIFAFAARDYYSSGMYTLPKRAKGKENVWLLFGDEENGFLTSSLADRLRCLGRTVKVLMKRDSLKQLASKEYIQNTLEEGTSNGKPTLEGVIYMWGLMNREERDQSLFAKPFLHLCQYLWDNQKGAPRIFVVTSNTCSVDESNTLVPSPSTLPAMVKVLNVETSLNARNIDLTLDLSKEDQVERVFYELWLQDFEPIVAYRMNKRFVPRLTKIKAANECLDLPKGCDRFQLMLPPTKVISDLQFGYLNSNVLEDDEIEVKVKAAALNFRDVFAVLKPDPQFDNINAIGTDFAGVVTAVGSRVINRKVGDAVFGCNLNDQQALPSHIKVREENTILLPDTLTFAEASTLPAVFSTAFYCLVTIANIKRGDTVLIHTATGGVGLSAIQIATHFGANIIATAGSERKRAYLRSLGIQRVFHSRTTEFGDKILEVTNGRGVDIVLNSLTGPGFKEATLRACALNSRFVEMSKLTIWKPEEVKSLRADVEYTVADLTTLEENTWKDLFRQMKEYVISGVVKPIPHVRFDAVNIRAALTYLQKAKHIGKIVCIMPEVKLEDAKLKSVTPLFNDRSTYMITGGIAGGIGLAVAKWMLTHGGKYLILVGRSKPSLETEELLQTWKSQGYTVLACQGDVGDFQQGKNLLRKIKEMGLPPLRGIMHAAGTLSDGIIPNQTWDKLLHTFNAKVTGSWNLHDLTKDLPLEFFAFFSSIASLFGAPAQINHSAGNYFEDSLAHYRNSLGLPATTINWGVWGQVGIATEVEIPGIRALSTQQGLSALEWILRSNRVQTGVINVDSFSMLAQYFSGIRNYINDRSLFDETKGLNLTINSDEFWSEIDDEEEPDGKASVFKKYIKIIVKDVLKMEPEEVIEDHAEFQTLGLDSLMMLEMKNNLQNLLGNRMTITASDFKGCNTTQLLGAKLVDLLMACDGIEEVLPTFEELKILMEEDAQLPTHVTSRGLEPAKALHQIKSVVVTGATGMLAPYILQIISNLSQISQIVCIVRKRGKTTGLDRLMSTLKANGLFERVNMDKVICLDGDVSQPRLGLENSEYEKLAESVHAVIHCAAKVDHVQPYRKTSPTEKFHVRPINVFGTKHILEFASFKTLKWVMHASTIAIICSVDEDKGCLSETWEPLRYIDHLPLNNGYSVSKYIAEQLVKQAVERGIPCKSVRFPLLSGDSKTGWTDIQGNHFMLRFLTYMKLGVMPTLPIPIANLPVDVTAEIATKLFFNESAPPDVYNIFPRLIMIEQEFPRVAATEFGRNIEIVEYSEFLKKLNECGNSSPIFAFREVYQNEELMKTLTTCPSIPSLEQWLRHDHNYFYSEKVDRYCPEVFDKISESPLQMVIRDLKYLQSIAAFEKFGL